MPLHVGPSTAFFVSTPVISGAIMETAARECDAAADRAGSWSAAEEKVDARKSMMCKRIRPDMFAELLDSPLVSRKKIEGGEIEAARWGSITSKDTSPAPLPLLRGSLPCRFAHSPTIRRTLSLFLSAIPPHPGTLVTG